MKYVEFKDAEVERVCLSKWDTDHDGKISVEEAQAVKSIGETFRGNAFITSFDELAQFGITAIPQNAFNACSSLTSVKIGDGVTTLGIGCFRSCTSLNKIDIGSSVISCAANTLLSSGNVRIIIMRSLTPPSVDYTFNIRGAVLYVPDESYDTYQSSLLGTYYPKTPNQYGSCMKKLSEYIN